MLCVYVIEIKYLQVLLTVNYIYKLMLIFLLPFVIRYVYNKCCKIHEKKLIDLLLLIRYMYFYLNVGAY